MDLRTSYPCYWYYRYPSPSGPSLSVLPSTTCWKHYQQAETGASDDTRTSPGLHSAGVPDEIYSLVTDSHHMLNAQFVKRGKRLDDVTNDWLTLPSLDDKATWLGAVALTFWTDQVFIDRSDSTFGSIATGQLLYDLHRWYQNHARGHVCLEGFVTEHHKSNSKHQLDQLKVMLISPIISLAMS